MNQTQCGSDMETDSGGSEHYPTRFAPRPVSVASDTLRYQTHDTATHRYLWQLGDGERDRNVKHNKEGKIRLIIAASTPRVVAH